MATDNSQIAQACNNLQQIKNGGDPRASTPDSDLDRAVAEMDRLFEEHEIPDCIRREYVHVYVADWQSKIGNCKYNKRIESDEYGKRVPGSALQYETNHYAIGVAKRAFDSKDTWKDTVAHELAHATAYVKNDNESPGHGTLWQCEADRLGADPTRTDRVSVENQITSPYYIGCPSCGKSWGRKRRSKTIKRPGRYSCSSCGTSCVSYEQGDEMPSEPGTCAVDCSDL